MTDVDTTPRLEGDLTVLATACPDWEVVDHPAPVAAPPAGDSREVIWEWDPLADPLIQMALARGTYRPVPGFGEMRCPALSPDGSLWARGPDSGSLVQLDRSGNALWMRQLEWDWERQYSAEVRIGPDGTAFLMRGYPVELLHVRPVIIGGNSEGLTRISLGESVEVSPTAIGTVAVGPRGRVYANPELEELVATCQGDAILWRLRLRVGAGPLQVLGLTVLPGGRVAVNTTASRPVIVSEAGEVEWLHGVAGERFQRGGGSDVMAVSEERLMWTIGVDRGTTFSLVVSDGLTGPSEERWRRDGLTGTDPRYLLDPAGMLWRAEPGVDSDRYERFDLDTPLWESRGQYCYIAAFGHFTSSSDVLCLREDGLIRIRATDGSIAWQTSELGEFVNDVDGRIYQIAPHPEGPEMTSTVVAYRTDALPPRGAFCVMQGCNRHRNNWAHDDGVP